MWQRQAFTYQICVTNNNNNNNKNLPESRKTEFLKNVTAEGGEKGGGKLKSKTSGKTFFFKKKHWNYLSFWGLFQIGAVRLFGVEHLFDVVGIRAICLARSFAAQFVVLQLGLEFLLPFFLCKSKERKNEYWIAVLGLSILQTVNNIITWYII